MRTFKNLTDDNEIVRWTREHRSYRVLASETIAAFEHQDTKALLHIGWASRSRINIELALFIKQLVNNRSESSHV